MSSLRDYLNDMAVDIAILREQVAELRCVLRGIEMWDCKGDSIKEAYDYIHGKGQWDKLLGKGKEDVTP